MKIAVQQESSQVQRVNLVYANKSIVVFTIKTREEWPEVATLGCNSVILKKGARVYFQELGFSYYVIWATPGRHQLHVVVFNTDCFHDGNECLFDIGANDASRNDP